MKRIVSISLSFLILHCSCNEDLSNTKVEDSNGFQISLSGDLTRSLENEKILDNMRLYCFSQGNNPLSGNGGSWNSIFSHQLVGITRTGMTLHTDHARTGNWDLVMVSGADAVFNSPVDVKGSSESLMYTYNPGEIRTDGSRNKAHEIWYRMLRLPEIKKDIQTTAPPSGITRNMSMVKVVVERAVDIDLASTNHKFELHGVPNKLSWSGTLLRETAPSVYETSTDNPDVLSQPLTGKFTFTDNSGVETGTYKSDTLVFIIPAHRETDFWTNSTTPKENAQDTITHKMSVSVSFDKASGGKFEKTASINRVHRCNGILLVRLIMKDVNLELKSTVTPWKPESVIGNIEAPYLNVSDVETTVYDGAASRIYFWSNQPANDIYILKEGNGISDVDQVFDRISGPDAVNRYYNATDKSGYIDIANLNLAAGQPDVKLYLKAGSLQREITVKRSVSAQALKKISTPYVGTFHRGNQVGERVVTWNYTGAWTAYLDSPANGAMIDRLPSPSLADGTLYGASPSDAEMGILSNTASSVTGMNTIYFRVGWDGTRSATDNPRYATVTIRQGTHNPSGTVIQKLYLRQGEKASAVYTTSRTNPARFSPYNLTSALPNAPIPAAADGIFTDYPSQCGSYFQWMDHVNPRYAYAASGAALPWNAVHPFYEVYWTEESPGLDEVYEVCPDGYRRVSDGGTSGEPTGTSELRQSLWENPSGASATNTLLGYYADGFFDRNAITSSITNVANSATGTGNKVAYKGRLFFNETSKASLFFPASGQRIQANGNLEDAGGKGYYWTASSTTSTTVPTGNQAYVSTSLRNAAVNIRCVEE